MNLRTPLMLTQELDASAVAIRFWNIGGRSQFLTLLQRFRGEFILAQSAKISGVDWLIVAPSQMQELQDFCRRYGLKMVREG